MRNNSNLIHFIGALTIFNRLIEGHKILNNEIKINHYIISKQLIDTWIGKRKKNKFPIYINQCFQLFVQQKQEISIDPQGIPGKFKKYSLSQSVRNMVKFDRFVNIFKNVEVIRIINITSVINKFYILEIINSLRNVNKLINNKLHTIYFKVTHPQYLIPYLKLYPWLPLFSKVKWRAQRIGNITLKVTVGI